MYTAVVVQYVQYVCTVCTVAMACTVYTVLHYVQRTVCTVQYVQLYSSQLRHSSTRLCPAGHDSFTALHTFSALHTADCRDCLID